MSAVGNAKIFEENEQFSFEITTNKEIHMLMLQNLPKPDFSSLKRKSERLCSKTNIALRAPKKVRVQTEHVCKFAARRLDFSAFTAKSAVG